MDGKQKESLQRRECNMHAPIKDIVTVFISLFQKNSQDMIVHTRVFVWLYVVFFILTVEGCNRQQQQYSAQTDSTRLSTPAQSQAAGGDTMTATLPSIVPEQIAEYPHDPDAFTQGLCFYKGELYESTGQYGSSSLRRVEWRTGKVQQQKSVANEFFAEGMTILNNKIYQLTWREQTGFVYDLASLKQIRTFSYYGEGWGLTNDSAELIMSDGSNILRFIEPEEFRVAKTLYVTYQVGGVKRPLSNLNELEYINGEIFANVWYSDSIARINPQTGDVTGWLDMRGFGSPEDRHGGNNVLNGIAYEPKRKSIFITGKLWKHVYEMRWK